MNNDQLHKDAVRLLQRRQASGTEATAKATALSYNKRRKQATAELRPILKSIWEKLESGESVGPYTSKEDWASHQSITIRQVQRIIAGPKKRPQSTGVVLKEGMTVKLGDYTYLVKSYDLRALAITLETLPVAKKKDDGAEIATPFFAKTTKKDKKDVRETAHFIIESNDKKGRAAQFKVVPLQAMPSNYFYDTGWMTLSTAKFDLVRAEALYVEMLEEIKEGMSCDHGAYYSPVYDKDGKEIEYPAHSVNPECSDCCPQAEAATVTPERAPDKVARANDAAYAAAVADALRRCPVDCDAEAHGRV
jgi:hypothetical protein